MLVYIGLMQFPVVKVSWNEICIYLFLLLFSLSSHQLRMSRLYCYLISTQKWLNRAKTGVLHGTPKKILRVSQDVFTMQNTQSTKINWKINFILYGLATRRLSVNKKSDTKQLFFPACRNWPICYITSEFCSRMPCRYQYFSNWPIDIIFHIFWYQYFYG